MIKRGIVVFCLCCYLANIVGFSFSLNYCNDKLAGLSFHFVDLFQWCCEDGGEDGCCDSQFIQLEKTDDHTTTVVVNSVSPDFALGFSPFVTHLVPSDISLVHAAGFNSKTFPTDIDKQPFYILYSVFRV